MKKKVSAIAALLATGFLYAGAAAQQYITLPMNARFIISAYETFYDEVDGTMFRKEVQDGETALVPIQTGETTVKLRFRPEAGSDLYAEEFLVDIVPADGGTVVTDPNDPYIVLNRLVNEERVKAGLPALDGADDLADAAVLRTDEVSTHFSHTRPNGNPWYTVMAKPGNFRGELFAEWKENPQEIMAAWLANPEDRAVLLNPDFKVYSAATLSGTTDGRTPCVVILFRG